MSIISLTLSSIPLVILFTTEISSLLSKALPMTVLAGASGTEDMKVQKSNLPNIWKKEKDDISTHLTDDNAHIDRVYADNLENALGAEQPVPESDGVSTSKVGGEATKSVSTLLSVSSPLGCVREGAEEGGENPEDVTS